MADGKREALGARQPLGRRLKQVGDRRSWLRLAATAVMLLTSGLLVLGIPLVADVVFPAYQTCSKALVSVQATVASIVPFAVWDVATLALLVWGAVVIVRRVRTRQSLLPCFSWAALVVSAALLLFVGWAGNHHAPSLAQQMGMEVRQYTVDELAQATEQYLAQAAQRAPQVPREQDGALAKQDFFELARTAGGAYEPLAAQHGVFEGPSLPVKALLIWGEPLLYSGHTGIFWAPTGEAGVPLNCATAELPFIMCHEAAHRLAIAGEQEANFSAFLACQASADVRFAYSGYYEAFCYCLNTLYAQDPNRAQQVLQDVADQGLYQGVVLVLQDREATIAHYDAYEGTFEKVGRTVNDTYLKSFGQQEGVRSYGLVVDYLIAWHLATDALIAGA